MRVRLWQLVALGTCASSAAATADVIVMQNGDRITGTISRIWGNDVSIEPDYADEFVVEIDKAKYVESTRDFDLTLDDGRKVTAQLQGAAPDGKQIVTYDGVMHYVAVTDLKQVEEVSEALDWESHIDANSTLTQGNTDSRVARLSGDATIEIGDHRHIATLLIADEESNGLKTKDQQFYTYTYNWLFSDKWFLGAGASYESDPIKQLDHRSILGAGLGRDIWDFHDRTLNFEFGLGTLQESFTGISETNTIAYWKFRFAYELPRPDLEFYHNHQINSYLSGRDNLFAKSSTGLRYDIGDDLFYLTMSLNVDYEKDPAPGTQKTDTTWVVGVGFEF